MKKVMLLFPPEWVPTAPYLALPSLTSVLRQNGIEVVQKDINVEMYDHFFTREFLEFARDKILSRIEHLKVKEARGQATEEDSKLAKMLTDYTYVDFDYHIEKVERAKVIMRCEEFYEVDKCEWALNAFREVMEYISAAYFPASINFYPMESNLNIYRPWVSEDLTKAPYDDDVNVYADVCRRLVFPAIEEEKPDLIGISIGTPVQLMAGITFSTLIKDRYPNIHITVGGNIITRLKDVLQKKDHLIGKAFDSMICYEGEHSIVRLVEALDGQRPMSEVTNLIYKDEAGAVHVNELYQERVTELPPPDFDGFPWEKYFSPEKLVPYLGTRGCYWGKCTFCDHGAGYIDQFRAKHADQIVDELEFLKKKYNTQHFLFTDESFPPALFKKLPPIMVDRKLDIFWTTLIRFEASLLEPEVWDKAAEAGCRSLYFGLESANQRIIKLVKKDTDIKAAVVNLSEARRVGIWSHVMAFYGFPSETPEEAEDTRRFLLANQDKIHSVEMYFFVLYKNAPVYKNIDDYKIKVTDYPEHDLAMDYYYTPESGLTIEEAMEKYQNFYRDDFDPWAMRINAREHVFLYITHFGVNDLPDLYVKNQVTAGEPQAMM
ncbi:MAG: radical SAM protein [Candidatus Nitrohelix vancouverensis]|uniref:Radical SAM protein n=1 Tax=Candidatus Nitrohelix vancouverensis TaxID=2705534 RepID=A0A7T0C4J3_9BACT|nr:MAG: radical SAM protein [Candidatus Nitrohelix vancouverensis]